MRASYIPRVTFFCRRLNLFCHSSKNGVCVRVCVFFFSLLGAPPPPLTSPAASSNFLALTGRFFFLSGGGKWSTELACVVVFLPTQEKNRESKSRR